MVDELLMIRQACDHCGATPELLAPTVKGYLCAKSYKALGQPAPKDKPARKA